MARLKAVGTSDANYANQGEVIRKIRQEEEFMTAMSEAPSTSTTFKIYKLTDTKKNGKYHMEGIDDVLHPERKRMERVRLLTGYPSIWVEDQKV